MADCLLPAGQAWYGRELHTSILVRLPSDCSKHLWCEQPVKEIQLTNICYVQICVYSSSYSESSVFVEETRLENRQRVSATRFTKTLIFPSNTKTMQMAWEEVAEVSYCYYSQDSREVVRKIPCLEAAKFAGGDEMFWDVLSAASLGRCARQRVKERTGEGGVF